MPALGLKMRIDRLTSLIASVYQTGLQMWHKFTATTWDGSTDRLPDSSPVGTNTAALYTGRGLSFDGVNDVVTVGATGTTVKTVVFYAYPDTTTTAFMQLQSTGAVRVEISSGTLSATGFTSPTLYVNGAASSTVAATTWQQIAVTSATGVSASNVLLGQSNTTYYGGDLSNVKFFSVELTAGQIAELYANPEQALPTGVSAGDLVGWWPMIGGIDQGVAFGNNLSGTINGATAISSINALSYQPSLKSQNRLTWFDGINDYISLGSNIVLSGDFTITVNCFLGSNGSLINFLGRSSTSLDRFSIQNTGAIELRANGSYNVWASAITTRNNFYNIVLSRIGTTVNLTINSVSIGNVTDGNAFTFNFLGAQNTGANPFLGIIYDVTLDGVGKWSNINNWVDEIGSNDGTENGSPVKILLQEGTTLNKDLFLQTLNVENNGYLILNATGYALAADAATLDITTDITLEAWVKPFTVASLQSAIGKNSAYALNITAGAKLQFQRWSSTTSATVSSTASLTADTWYHIAATYDGTTTKLYIDGTEDTSSGAVTGAIDSTATDVLLGALTTSTNLFSGYLDSVKVYDEVLTAAQIKTNYNAEKGSHSNS